MSTLLRPLLALCIGIPCLPLPAAEPPPAAPRYEHGPASRDGIGKFFLGREIARVMGHQGAGWLERPEREQEERASLVLPALQLRPGDTVADLGCGTGYFTWRLARAVGSNGVVYAVDIQPEMLDLLDTRLKQRDVHNVKPVLGTATDPQLPGGALDLVLLVDVYHEFDHPYEMMEKVCAALKPGGRVALVEYRAEDPAVPIKPLHKMTEAQVRREMSLHPLEWVETIHTLPRQHLILFRRKP